ncbi:hypothetical protein WR25_07152 [Diploscapter pachys]|uniref:Regulatory protein SIR2 homolog 7 n=1 Tax=Diploscapter pachys TaxID=2018661 RepID=A0A2A2J2K3_9BILA|nr:hypothetical protein WR25_07152 [Diploscapter pachys]
MPSNSAKNRKKEFVENEKSIDLKVERLKKLMLYSRCTVIYTGAGISTSAAIPDYRGPSGLWTLASQGKDPLEIDANLLNAEPTLSHMVIKELYRQNIVDHVLSQNCDGLHLRSGLPQKALSEIHGNMYVEVCSHCSKQHVRHFDVTAKSSFRKHGTGRPCSMCRYELQDTIVHFGELGKVPFPLNWEGITPLVPKADLIICLGTSLQVLKSYKMLWPDAGSHTKLVIVNLQWTPKDNIADIKIHGKCDVVLEKLAERLELDLSRKYCRDCDIVTNPRRQSMARDKQLMNDIRDCTCHIRPPRLFVDSPAPSVESRDDTPSQNNQPGWWSASFQRMSGNKKALKVPGRKRGRPRKCSTDDEPSCSTSSAESTDPTFPEPKRKRGRPPKISLEEEVSALTDEEIIDAIMKRMIRQVLYQEKKESEDSEEPPARRVTRSQVATKKQEKQNDQSSKKKKKKSKYLEPQDSVSTTMTSESDEEESEDENEEEGMDEQARCSAEQFYDNGGEIKLESPGELEMLEVKTEDIYDSFNFTEASTSQLNAQFDDSATEAQDISMFNERPFGNARGYATATVTTTAKKLILPFAVDTKEELEGEITEDQNQSSDLLMVKTEEPALNIEAIVAQNELCHDTYICPEQTLREFFAMQKARNYVNRISSSHPGSLNSYHRTYAPRAQGSNWSPELRELLHETVQKAPTVDEGLAAFMSLPNLTSLKSITLRDVLAEANAFQDIRERFIMEGISKNTTSRSMLQISPNNPAFSPNHLK